MRRTAATLVVGVSILAGCSATSADTDESRKQPDGASTVAPPEAAAAAGEYDGPRIPDGSWSRVATLDQARRRDLDPAVVRPHLGSDRRMPIELVLEGNSWTVLVTEDDGVTLPGDLGTFTYDERGRFLATSESEGCPGCEALLEWRLQGDALRMWFAEDAAAGDDARLVHEGTFRRTE